MYEPDCDLIEDSSGVTADIELENSDTGQAIVGVLLEERRTPLRVDPIVIGEGQSFGSYDEMYDAYQGYAKRRGFAIVKASKTKGKDGALKFVQLTCHKARNWSGRNNEISRAVQSMRTGCTARVSACRGGDAQWRVTTFIDDHNHPLNPDGSRYIRQHRRVSPYVKRRLEINDMAGISPNRSIRALYVEAGGADKLGCVGKDCRNYIEQARSWRLGGGDAEALTNMFVRMQKINSHFFYAIDTDEEGRIKNVLWVDCRSRLAYKEFCDVVTFDTTYLVNKYEMPFAPFVGVNHHRQSVLLGCALLSDEEANSFSWVFRTWLKCMDDNPPAAILTDQCRSIRKAIQETMPTARHRWCMWHIVSKFPEKLGRVERYRELRDFFSDIVYDVRNPRDFEEKWSEMVSKFELSENVWLSKLFDKREMWVPAYLKDFFWAAMQSTQRSESMNAFFDGYVNHGSCLKQFVEQYEFAIREKIEKEMQADHEASSVNVSLVSTFSWERQFRDAFTKKNYLLVRQEICMLMYCDVISQTFMHPVWQHVVEEISVGRNGDTYGQKYEVDYDCEAATIRCSCCKFEMEGILCRHALCVFKRRGVQDMPEKYILRRWRKDVHRAHSGIMVGPISDALDENRVFSREVEQVFHETLFKIKDDKESMVEFLRTIQSYDAGLRKSLNGGTRNITGTRNVTKSSVTHNGTPLKEPKVARKRGRPRKNRLEKEQAKAGKKKKPTEQVKEVSKGKSTDNGQKREGEKSGLGRKGMKQNAECVCGPTSHAVEHPTNVTDETKNVCNESFDGYVGDVEDGCKKSKREGSFDLNEVPAS